MTISDLVIAYANAATVAEESERNLRVAKAEHDHNLDLVYKRRDQIINYMTAEFKNYLLEQEKKEGDFRIFFGGNLVGIIIGKDQGDDLHGKPLSSNPADVTDQFRDFVDNYKPLEIEIKKYS